MGKEAIKQDMNFLGRGGLSKGISGVKAAQRNLQTEEKLADQHDMGQAKDSYAIFNAIFKWGTIAAAITTILVVAIIASRAA